MRRAFYSVLILLCIIAVMALLYFNNKVNDSDVIDPEVIGRQIYSDYYNSLRYNIYFEKSIDINYDEEFGFFYYRDKKIKYQSFKSSDYWLMAFWYNGNEYWVSRYGGVYICVLKGIK